MTRNKATLVGLIAIVLWSTIVGLIRTISEGFGPVGGAALIYTLSALLLLCIVGFPKISAFPRAYLIAGTLLFVSYELCLSLSLGYANTSSQAIEVGMVNYLWPGMTILFSLLAGRQRIKPAVFAGLIISLTGICLVLGGDKGFSLNEIVANIRSNPLSYGLAFSGAVIWSVYCVLTRLIAKGSNGITLFFMLTAVALWIKFSLGTQPDFTYSPGTLISLVMAAGAMGLGYAAWNTGILHGNVTILATASYFVPVISSVLAAVMLQSSLSIAFWQGAGLVCLGSLVCWLATRRNEARQVSQTD